MRTRFKILLISAFFCLPGQKQSAWAVVPPSTSIEAPDFAAASAKLDQAVKDLHDPACIGGCHERAVQAALEAAQALAAADPGK